MDYLTKEQRTALMAKVKSKDTKPEKRVRSLLHSMGFRFRLHIKCLPGCPDIVLPKYKTVIFVHGCFWHRHEGCKACRTPRTNVNFWGKKFQKTTERDKAVLAELERIGWTSIVIWECETRDLNLVERTIFEELVSSRI